MAKPSTQRELKMVDVLMKALYGDSCGFPHPGDSGNAETLVRWRIWDEWCTIAL
ncbi:MAG: hypothetical protein R3B93_12935 [Bacteroidia bacterium]